MDQDEGKYSNFLIQKGTPGNEWSSVKSCSQILCDIYPGQMLEILRDLMPLDSWNLNVPPESSLEEEVTVVVWLFCPV